MFFFFFFRGPCLSCVRFNYDLILGVLSGGSENRAVTNEAGTVVAGVWLHPSLLSLLITVLSTSLTLKTAPLPLPSLPVCLCSSATCPPMGKGVNAGV